MLGYHSRHALTGIAGITYSSARLRYCYIPNPRLNLNLPPFDKPLSLQSLNYMNKTITPANSPATVKYEIFLDQSIRKLKAPISNGDRA